MDDFWKFKTVEAAEVSLLETKLECPKCSRWFLFHKQGESDDWDGRVLRCPDCGYVPRGLSIEDQIEIRPAHLGKIGDYVERRFSANCWLSSGLRSGKMTLFVRTIRKELQERGEVAVGLCEGDERRLRAICDEEGWVTEELAPPWWVVRQRALAFDELRKANVERSEQAFGHPVTALKPSEWTNAIAGEVGELCNLTHKLSRGEDVPVEAMAKEVADAIIYLDLFAASIDLDDVGRFVRKKFNEVSERFGSEITL